MSKETSQWLNTNTLIGFTGKRGNAWHYRAEHQGEESNHYVGAIPADDVARRLFYWEPVRMDVTLSGVVTDWANATDTEVTVPVPSKVAIMHPVTQKVFGFFGSDSYEVHGYSEFLMDKVGEVFGLTNGQMQVSSAGLLREGGQAWVQFEMPETVDTPEGVSFRPFFLAATSLDGSISTTYQTGSQLVVCDNTLSAALSETTNRKKIKHTKNSVSAATADDIRAHLELVAAMPEQFSEQIKTLCETTVTDAQLRAFLDIVAPVGKSESKRGGTVAEKKRDAFETLITSDARVSPWKGTAFGVVQMMNTYEHHVKGLRGADRAGLSLDQLREQRNMERVVSGDVDKLDRSTLATLGKVLATV